MASISCSRYNLSKMAFGAGTEIKLLSPFWEKRFRAGVYPVALSVSTILVKMFFLPIVATYNPSPVAAQQPDTPPCRLRYVGSMLRQACLQRTHAELALGWPVKRGGLDLPLLSLERCGLASLVRGHPPTPHPQPPTQGQGNGLCYSLRRTWGWARRCQFFCFLFHPCTSAFVLFSHMIRVRYSRSPPATATRAERSWRNPAEVQDGLFLKAFNAGVYFNLTCPFLALPGEGECRWTTPCNILPRQRETSVFTASQHGNRFRNDLNVLEELIK